MAKVKKNEVDRWTTDGAGIKVIKKKTKISKTNKKRGK